MNVTLGHDSLLNLIYVPGTIWGSQSALEQTVSALCLCLWATRTDRAGSQMRAIEIYVFRTGFSCHGT